MTVPVHGRVTVGGREHLTVRCNTKAATNPNKANFPFYRYQHSGSALF
jgi:hypothetical protein